VTRPQGSPWSLATFEEWSRVRDPELPQLKVTFLSQGPAPYSSMAAGYGLQAAGAITPFGRFLGTDEEV
jgi:hypothetical protein